MSDPIDYIGEPHKDNYIYCFIMHSAQARYLSEAVAKSMAAAKNDLTPVVVGPDPSELNGHLVANPDAALLCRQVFYAPDGDMTAFGLSCTPFQDDHKLTARLLELSKADPEGRNICALPRKSGDLPLHDAVRSTHVRSVPYPEKSLDVPLSTIKLLVREFPAALTIRSTRTDHDSLRGTPLEMARAKSPQDPDMVALLAACTEAFEQKRYDEIAELCKESSSQ